MCPILFYILMSFKFNFQPTSFIKILLHFIKFNNNKIALPTLTWLPKLWNGLK